MTNVHTGLPPNNRRPPNDKNTGHPSNNDGAKLTMTCNDGVKLTIFLHNLNVAIPLKGGAYKPTIQPNHLSGCIHLPLCGSADADNDVRDRLSGSDSFEPILLGFDLKDWPVNIPVAESPSSG